MNEYIATLLREQKLLAEEILSCKHSFRTPAMEMATATQKAPGAKAEQPEGKAAVSPQTLQADSVPGAPLFRDVPMQLVQGHEAARQSVDISDAASAVSMRAISRYFQRDARRFREE